MYVKKLVLDGFKSYGKRTEIEGFDPEFTAITGLNGSGKSNILDSICFVLGISNLQNVRASALQDLVFKNGQAGITKATVTIVFDNTNAQQCPPGYEKCREISVTRQVVVGGKNKFLINGKLVQNKKVQDFFCSIQLNVNNPNFLIMQGKIQQVLNMKPKEVLSMVEEAAGTSVYKTKRDATKTLIEKKEGKVRETSALLEEEVLPKLDKLRKERTAYQEYQKICRDIEFLTYIFISARYLKLCDALQSVEASEEKIENRIATCRETHARNLEEIESTDVKVKDIQHKIDEEMGGALKSLEEQLSAKRAIEAKASGSLKAAKGTIEQDQKKIRMANKNISEDEAALLKKQQAMAMVKDEFQGLKDADANDAKAYEDAKRKLEAVSQGLSTNEDGEACTLQEQLIAAKQQHQEMVDNLEKYKQELDALQQNSSSAATEVSELEKAIKEQKDNLNSQNKEMRILLGKKEKMLKQNQELELEVKKKENEKSKISAEAKDAKKRMDALEVKYPWIPEEKSFFGMKNTRYDYSKEDPVEAGNKLTKMQEKKEKMERTLNMNAMQTLDREEENYNETVRRRQIVAQDKEKIKQIIVKLDEEEQGQVKRAWEAVTENFSGIFSTLLPGAQALLKPVKTNGILSGLEIKVGFNGVFKDSLGELSGGQKSLVALSLVLAMLKFSPAPLYILDEVDAALDMSHTQNIGSMLKQHFRDSQFLIVSLKDGLFNHANVLFRTQFLEGVSTISRTVGRSTAKR
ncbi:structural maintenance of chromosomes protein 2 isoform X2 [Drosophila sulfurigaster albostrigata]|uniref:structural maintenance of chromosomes protein 2 isoform X2 n=1 Tax=Drosophila sulfurigaster albostrigata TaxID=89887 RepID=UPI002D21ADFA|nr:structural maintenance of chromosomes protein 2 isoform X2 [Drosophila sulfurigaster albostrigata]